MPPDVSCTKAKMHTKSDFRRGSASDTAGGAYSSPQTLLLTGGREKRGMGRGRKKEGKGKGKGKERGR